MSVCVGGGGGLRTAATDMKPQRSHHPSGVILFHFSNRHFAEGDRVDANGTKEVTFQTDFPFEETYIL